MVIYLCRSCLNLQNQESETSEKIVGYVQRSVYQKETKTKVKILF